MLLDGKEKPIEEEEAEEEEEFNKENETDKEDEDEDTNEQPNHQSSLHKKKTAAKTFFQKLDMHVRLLEGSEIKAALSEIEGKGEDDETALVAKNLIDTILSQAPQINLERASVRIIRFLIFALIITCLMNVCFSVALSLITVALYEESASLFVIDVRVALEYAVGAYTTEGVLRSLGLLLVSFLLISFPQRIYFESVRMQDRVLREQWMITFYIVLIFITPIYSIYGIYSYWNILQTVLFSKLSSTTTDFETYLILLELMAFYDDFGSPSESGFGKLAIAITMSLIFLNMGSIPFFQSTIHRKEYHHLEPKSPGKKTSSSTVGSARNEEDIDNEIGDMNEGEAMQRMGCFSKTLEAMRGMYWSGFRAYGKARRNYKQWTFRLPVGFTLAIFAYFTLTLAFVYAFDFRQSLVPFVSIVTIFRICPLNANDFLALNFSSNSTANYSVRLAEFSNINRDSNYVCSPKNSLQFNRMVAVIVMTAVEIYIVVMVIRISEKARRRLRAYPYLTTRSKQLSFIFYQVITKAIWPFMVVGGIVLTAVPPVDYWTLSHVEYFYNKTIIPIPGQNKSRTFETVNLNVTWDPLYIVGITGNTIGFGPYYFSLAMWILLMSYAFLPPDAYYMNFLVGFFIGDERRLQSTARTEYDKVIKQIKRGANKSTTNLARSEDQQLLYFARETDFQTLMDLRRQTLPFNGGKKEKSRDNNNNNMLVEQLEQFGKKTKEQIQKHLKRSMSTVDSNVLYETAEEQRLFPIANQVRANVFVLETEILLYHFMHCTYTMAGVNPATGAPYTFEEKAAMIEDVRFKLVKYLHNEDTDNHCLIAVGEDRIVVAFRGTVSYKNMKTDYDSALVFFPPSENVPPLIHPDSSVIYKREASKPALVHQGFLKSYTSVSDEIRACVKPFLNGRRVLFTTGHSLGGGLAAVCAFDLAVFFNLERELVAFTSWGCPKVGSFGFERRFAKLVPCARRFAMADDFITDLPIEPWRLASLTYKGFFHVGTEILLESSGNLMVKPSQMERYVQTRFIKTLSAHLRMNYATALMAWAVRTHNEILAKESNWWWVMVINLLHKNAKVRLRNVAPEVRERLLQDLSRPGVAYIMNGVNVRDMAVEAVEAVVVPDGEKKPNRISMPMGVAEELKEKVMNATGDADIAQIIKQFFREHDIELVEEEAEEEDDSAQFVDALSFA